MIRTLLAAMAALCLAVPAAAQQAYDPTYAGPVTGEPDGLNPAWYLAHNPDVAAAGAKDQMSAERHWLAYGKKEGRKPYDPAYVPPADPLASVVARVAALEAASKPAPVASPVPSPTASPTPAKGSFLQVNLSGAEGGGASGVLGQDYVYPSEATLRYFAGRGITTVRLPVLWERLQPKAFGPLDAAKIGELDTVMTTAANVGVGVIIDIHGYGGRDGVKLGSATLPTTALADFWGKFAAYGKGRFAGYDLMNEPNAMPSGAWQTAAQQAINAIATVDPDTDVYVEGDGWSGAQDWPAPSPWIGTLTHPKNKLVFSAHSYWDSDRSGTYRNGASTAGYGPADYYRGHYQLDFVVNWARANHARVHIGEFGTPADPSWAPVIAEFLKAAYADRDVLTGVTWWAAGEWMDGYPLTIQPAKDGNWTDRPQMTALMSAQSPNR